MDAWVRYILSIFPVPMLLMLLGGLFILLAVVRRIRRKRAAALAAVLLLAGAGLVVAGMLDVGAERPKIEKLKPYQAHIPICMWDSPTLPADAKAFDASLRKGIAALCSLPQESSIAVEAKAWPAVDALKLDVTEGKLAYEHRVERRGKAGPDPHDLSIALLTARGLPVFYDIVPIQVTMVAHDVRLGIDLDKKDNPILMLNGVHDGTFDLSIAKNDLEALLLLSLRYGDARKIFNTEDCQITFVQHGPRSVTAETVLHISKLYVHATVHVTAKLDIDDNYIATVSDLALNIDGLVGGAVSSVLKPALDPFDGKRYDLRQYIGDLPISDLELKADDKSLHVTAMFGS